MNDEHTNQTDQHDDQVETLLREASTAIRPDDQTRQAIRARVLVASKDASEGDTSSAAEHNGGRKRRRFAWAASVALLVTGAIIASFVLWPTPLTLAAVVEALEDVDWVYIKYDNGDEHWRSPTRGVSASRNPVLGFSADGLARYRVSFTDSRRGEEYWSPQMISASSSGFIQRRAFEPREYGATAWDWLVKPLEDEIEVPAKSGRREVERHEDSLDNRRVIRFDSYIIDVMDQRVLTQQLWADPESRLPIRTRTRIHGKEPDDNPDPGFKNGVFEFPESGPTSIYDLGAARDLPIIDWDAIIEISPEAARVLEAMRAAERQFPESYRVIYWSNDRHASEIDVIILDGKSMVTFIENRGWATGSITRGRQARYFNQDERSPDYHLPKPATAAEVLAWTHTQTPGTLHVSDGERSFDQRGPFAPMLPDHDKVQLRVGRGGLSGYNQRWPHRYQWPIAYHGLAWPIERYEPDPDKPHLIGLRVEYGDRREEYIVDASHDYICVEFSMYQKRGEVWFKQSTDSWGDFERLPSGAWFATSRRLVTPDDPLRGYSANETTWSIHIEEVDPDQLPPDTFDGDLVLEKAKALGATITTY